MFSCSFYLFCLLGIQWICLCDGSSTVKKCAEGDRQALLKFKASLMDEDGTLSSWNGDDCCKWERITCDNSTGHVTRLYLNDVFLRGGYFGTNEDGEIGWFTYKAILAWKGANREYGKILGLMKAIDLSCNKITGEIPHSITNLVALTSLNLSGNNLTGFIPDNISHIKMLESLDLSRNYLDGGIPASLWNLTFLSYMNLSFNNLSVNIPISTHPETFDAYTYIGNPELCGQPLPKKCPRDKNSLNPQPNGSTNRNDTTGDEDELIRFGFYISLGLGFIFGFWGVFGTLILKTSWRYAYFRFFNNMYNWIYVQLVVVTFRLKRRLQVQD